MKTAQEIQQELERVKAQLAAACRDIEEMIWLYGPCRFCAHSKRGGDRYLDRPCKICEPKWRGLKNEKRSEK